MRFSRSIPAGILALSLAFEPAAAVPFVGTSKQPAVHADNPVVQVQHRRGGGGGGRRHGGGGGGNDAGAIAAGAILGLAIGAIIASQAQRQACAQRYRSYNPNTGTFVGRNGRIYRCP